MVPLKLTKTHQIQLKFGRQTQRVSKKQTEIRWLGTDGVCRDCAKKKKTVTWKSFLAFASWLQSIQAYSQSK